MQIIKHRKWRELAMGTMIIAASCVTSGCSGLGATATPAPSSSTNVQSGSGVVESIDMVKGNDPGLVGAIIGGVAGGALGTQIGSGRGTSVATIAGVIGGALAGREVERRVQSRDNVHKVIVRMDNGVRQTIAMEHTPDVRPGDRVRIDGGHILRE